jgi:transposase-like protein
MGQITVFSGPERRRRWSEEDRRQILAEAFLPGACVAEVARRHDVSTGLVYTWRRKLREARAEPLPVGPPDPQAWLADVLARIADHPASRLDELLPWNWRKDKALLLQAA